jgi:hypothetical protein
VTSITCRSQKLTFCYDYCSDLFVLTIGMTTPTGKERWAIHSKFLLGKLAAADCARLHAYLVGVISSMQAFAQLPMG